MIEPVAEEKPVVYSCSGSSGAAQMANYLAVQLDRSGIAEIINIGEVGGNVKKQVYTVQPGRKIITIDGCPSACSRECLANHNIVSNLHFELSSFGVNKKDREDFDRDEANRLLKKVEALISGKNTETTPENLQIPETVFYRNSILNSGKLSEKKQDIIIKEAVNKEQLRAFIEFPYRLFRANKYFVPPLKKDVRDTFYKNSNPAFEFCEARYWLAWKGEKVVGRIAGIINHAYIKKWGSKFIRFGWIDFENDEQIARGLLKQVETWAKEKGMIAVHGPLGFTNFDNAGMLIEGFDQVGTFATNYNYPYYPLLMEKAGYSKDVDWVEYKIKVPDVEPEKLERIKTIVEKKLNLNLIKPGKIKDILPYVEKIFGLLNSTYSGLYGMVPLTDRQIHFYSGKYLSLIRPDFVSLITDEKGELVAFGITIPSLSLALQKAKGCLYPFGFIHILRALRKNKLADLCLIAIRKDFQGKGVNGLLMHEITRAFLKNNIEYAESNPELEQNKKVQSIWEHYDAIQHKRRRCYIKYL